jgi:hypothetical protein
MGRMALVCLTVATTVVSAGPGRIYLTTLGRRILTQTDQVVEARVLEVQPAFRGITTARIEVSERFAGFDREKLLVLMYIDELTAPDAFGSTLEKSTISFQPGVGARKVARETETDRAPAGSRRMGVRLAKGEAGVFFLKRKGATYSLVGLIPLRDPLYETKRNRLREVLRLESISALDLRASQAKRFYLKSIESENVWERGNSARELLSLARRLPDVFTAEEGERLAAILYREKEDPIRASLERTIRMVNPKGALEFARKAEEEERRRFSRAIQKERERLDGLKNPDLRAVDLVQAGRRFGRAVTGLAGLYLSDPAPIVRESAARTLAAHGGPSCRVALREALETESERQAAMAMIHALGVQSDPAAVRVVAARLSDPALERAAIQALARIGGADARRALERHGARASDETAALIIALLREEFSEGS